MTLTNWFPGLLKSKAGKRRELLERAGRCGTVVFLVLALLVCWGACQYQYRQMRGLVRLHIVAHSNTLADQQVKQLVCRAVLDSLARQGVEVVERATAGRPGNGQNHSVRAPVAAGPSHSAAWKNQWLNPPLLSCAARQAVLRAGADYPVTITLGERDYPAKVLGGPLPRTVPAGEYTALQIYLGEGRGYNWWGVLYPPLCFGVRSEQKQEGFGEIPRHARTGKVQLRSYFWDSMQKLLNL